MGFISHHYQPNKDLDQICNKWLQYIKKHEQNRKFKIEKELLCTTD